MAKCTPSFEAMIAARGGAGSKQKPGAKAPTKPPKGGKMRADTDKDGY